MSERSEQEILNQDKVNLIALENAPDAEQAKLAKETANAHLEDNREVIESAAIEDAKAAGVETSFGTYDQDPEKFVENTHERVISLCDRAGKVAGSISELELDTNGIRIGNEQSRYQRKEIDSELLKLTYGNDGYSTIYFSKSTKDGDNKIISLVLTSNDITGKFDDEKAYVNTRLEEAEVAKYSEMILDKIDALITEAETSQLSEGERRRELARTGIESMF